MQKHATRIIHIPTKCPHRSREAPHKSIPPPARKKGNGIRPVKKEKEKKGGKEKRGKEGEKERKQKSRLAKSP